MPIPVDYITFQQRPYQIEYLIQSDQNGTRSNSEFVLERDINSYQSNTIFNYEQFNDNKKYLKLKSKIQKQIESKKKFYKGLSTEFIEKEFAACTNELFEIQPDLISVELTSEQSLFYTLKKNSFTLFFQYFISENKYNQSEEALLSIFNNDNKLPSKEGDRNTVISFAKDMVSK